MSLSVEPQTQFILIKEMEKVMQLTNEKLHEVCLPVGSYEDMANCASLFLDMLALLEANSDRKGVGLAANQVGDTRRCILIHTKYFKAGMINPVILDRSCGKVKSTEGCLSFGINETATVMRDKQVTVEWYDTSGNRHKQKFRDLEARVIQHEIDHLNGITIFERALID